MDKKKQEDPKVQLKALQNGYHKLVHAISVYLEAEHNLAEAGETFHKASEAADKAYNYLWDVLQGKEE